MTTMRVKGHEFPVLKISSSSSRRAVLFKNNIIASLKKLSIHEDDIEVPLERLAIRRVPAKAEWYLDGSFCQFDYALGKNYLENLYVVSKVIELEVAELLSGAKSEDKFIFGFSEKDDFVAERKKARELLGVAADCKDMQEINAAYKKLARQNHPDMGGDMEKFKQINNAHKVLKRELE